MTRVCQGMTGGSRSQRLAGSGIGSGTRRLTRVVTVLGCLVATMGLATSARADFGVVPGSFDGGAFTAGGDAYTQAAGHPYEAWTSFDLNRTTTAFGAVIPDGGLRDVDLELPAGFVGNPTAAERCSGVLALMQDEQGLDRVSCPDSSQVGVAAVTIALPAVGVCCEVRRVPLYSIKPPPGSPAAFAFRVINTVVLLTASVRSDGDYGVDVNVRGASQAVTVYGTKVTLWGVPADPVHDADRGFVQMPGETIRMVCAGTEDPVCTNPAGVPERAFLTNPTSCSPAGVGLETRLHMTSWDGRVADARFLSHLPPGFPSPPADWGPQTGATDCDRVPFAPAILVRPTVTQADSPTGLDIELTIPQDDLLLPGATASAHLKRTTVTLPEGMTINPAAADGLAACSDAQLGLGSASPAQCPDASKVGTVELVTPLLDEPVEGGVYIRSQASGDPASGEMFRLAIEVRSDRLGIVVKLPGEIRADPATGRLETTFDGNPQLPFSRLSLHLKEGPRAPLATPPTCGPHTTHVVFTSWARPAQETVVADTFSIDCPGMTGFAPSFSAGQLAPLAGAFSPLMVSAERRSGQEFVDGLRVNLPPGLLARIRDVPLCPDAAADAGTCAEASRVATVTVAAGPGDRPFFLTGRMYLTTAYRGGPYGLAIVVPAVAGPFDLGLVVVRQAVLVDPRTAEVSALSDPIPTIVKGVPPRLRLVDVRVDRPQFITGPTSCAEKRIQGILHSQQGSSFSTGARFQVEGCSRLPLRPAVELALAGRRQGVDGGHPGLTASVRQPSGQANLRTVVTTLPKSLALDPDRAQSNNLCEFEAGQRADCPSRSVIGRATATSPLLNRPLTGPVYFVKNVRIDPRTGNRIRTLPTLLITLRGEIALDLRATTAVEGGKLVTKFAAIPDAAVSRFRLVLRSGRRGILVTTRDLCGKRRVHVTDVEIDGQNGKRFDRAVRMTTPCPNGKRPRR